MNLFRKKKKRTGLELQDNFQYFLTFKKKFISAELKGCVAVKKPLLRKQIS